MVYPPVAMFVYGTPNLNNFTIHSNQVHQRQMEIHLSTKFYAQATSALAVLLLFYCLIKWKNNTSKQKPPQPCGSWPFIGHLPILGKLPHLSLGTLADKYGPIFMIKLGVHQALVISSAQAAKEALIINDKLFANRPQTIVVEHLGYNSAMFGFSQYGSYWREIKKIVTIELLSNYRLEKLKHVRISEVRSAIKTIYDIEKNAITSSLVDMKHWFNEITMNASVRLIAGKSLNEFYQGEERNRWVMALREFFELSAVLIPADALPFLRWFDIGGYEKAMKKAQKKIDSVVQGWVDEHRERRISTGGKETQDFIDVMLGIFETPQQIPSEFEQDTVIKATSMAMILGGTDTTAVTLTWALSLLLNNRDTLRKAQNEIDGIVGKERKVNESDIKELIYLQAVVKETLRLYPAAPLPVPREAIADCNVSGYHIRAGTRLFINLYKIHRDPAMWEDPLVFLPERFLTSHKNYDVRGQNSDYIPFGTGCRICPGISFAMQMLHYTLANLLHGFDISTPSDEGIDMTEGYGMTNLKATPLDVILTPRLPDHVYSDIS